MVSKMAESMPLSVLVLVLMAVRIEGHGRLIQPPSRASMWRYGFDNPANYNDNQLFCGGYQNQWAVNGGKCGICGDPWQGPREHEAGGLYANGIIVQNYQPGVVMDIVLEITANHKGWHEFHLCANNDVTKNATLECLDEHLLELSDGSGTRWYQLPGNQKFTIPVKLPAGLVCTQCVLQWKWNTGNRWGTDPDGTTCTGCGPQEQFYGCSDISIG